MPKKEKHSYTLYPQNLNTCCVGADFVIYKELKTNKIFVKCSDCETTYDNIEDALYGRNPIKDTFGERDFATLNEISETYYEKEIMVNYNGIPDGASDEEINMYITAFLHQKERMIEEVGLEDTFENLARIAEHDTINGYKDEHIKEISNFIEKNLDYDNYEIMDIILTIVIQMNLESVWNKIITVNNITNKKVVALIADAKRENSKYKYFNAFIYIPQTATDLINKMKERGFKGEIYLENERISWKIYEKVVIEIYFNNQPNEAYISFPDGSHKHISNDELWEYLDFINTAGGVMVIKKGIFGTFKKLYINNDNNIKLPKGEKIYF